MCRECGCESERNCGCGGECGCDERHFERRYKTKAEQITGLESYLSDLQTEIQAVEERLADLRK